MIKELSVILPLHNKEHCIEDTVEALLSTNLIERIQIIIVENESTDNSFLTAKKVSSSMNAEKDITILKSTKGNTTKLSFLTSTILPTKILEGKICALPLVTTKSPTLGIFSSLLKALTK